MPPTALITGITGQDGSYLAEHLLELGYQVHGLVRRVHFEDQRHRFQRLEHVLDRVVLHEANVESFPALFKVFSEQQFDECYHLAAQSFVAETFFDGFSTMNVNISGTYHVLASLLQHQPHCRFYFAGTSEMFGAPDVAPQNESTRFRPRSPYGISKVAGFHLVETCRRNHGTFCVGGILFNHESPRRGHQFVTRKITSGAARIHFGLEKSLFLGNLDARRDWGHSRDYVRAMHLMLQQAEPDDYVIATGETHAVREICELAFGELGMDYQAHVKVDPRFYRGEEEFLLTGDASKARRVLGWAPTITFADMIREMLRADVEEMSRDRGSRQ